MQDSIDFQSLFEESAKLFKNIMVLDYSYNPRKVVHSTSACKLYHYASSSKSKGIPLLIVFATINKTEILDLIPQNSFIKGLLNQGIDVYLLDWNAPSAKDIHLTIDNYVLKHLSSCVDFITKKNAIRKINLLGICQGGLFSLCYNALFQNIKNLILISTPINFNTRYHAMPNLLKRLDESIFIDLNKNIPGFLIKQFFVSLRPFEVIGKKYLKLLDILKNTEASTKFLLIEKWWQDTNDQTLASFLQMVEVFCRKNALFNGKLQLDRKKVCLDVISNPILNIIAKQDAIVAMSSSKALKQLTTSKHYHELIVTTGHLGIYLNEKLTNRVTQKIAEWLQQH